MKVNMVAYPDIHILYVDDEKDNLFVFKANFKRKFDVITAISPIDALDQLEANYRDIKVVISDMRMPQMSGLTFIRKAKEKYSDISYFILTGYGHSKEIQEALSSHLIDQCFTKPFDVDEIESTILNAVLNK